jgi:two-component system chemotaxis response regulator CheY
VPDSPRRILVVEDSPMMVRFYQIALGGSGAELLFAADGEEGLDRAATEPGIDLFLVDINMPRMDGLEFLRRLRGELGVTDAPAIVVSTEAAEADRAAAAEAGADGYLQKPWTPQQLSEAIRRVAPGFAA